VHDIVELSDPIRVFLDIHRNEGPISRVKSALAERESMPAPKKIGEEQNQDVSGFADLQNVKSNAKLPEKHSRGWLGDRHWRSSANDLGKSETEIDEAHAQAVSEEKIVEGHAQVVSGYVKPPKVSSEAQLPLEVSVENPNNWTLGKISSRRSSATSLNSSNSNLTKLSGIGKARQPKTTMYDTPQELVRLQTLWNTAMSKELVLREGYKQVSVLIIMWRTSASSRIQHDEVSRSPNLL
jgi:hypothetical protein